MNNQPTSTWLDEAIGDFKVDVYHSCCMNEECDGYHPGQDESDRKAVAEFKAKLEARIAAERKDESFMQTKRLRNLIRQEGAGSWQRIFESELAALTTQEEGKQG